MDLKASAAAGLEGDVWKTSCSGYSSSYEARRPEPQGSLWRGRGGVGWGGVELGERGGGRLGVGLLLSPPQDANLHPFSTPRGLEKKREKVFILLESKKIPLLHSVKK